MGIYENDVLVSQLTKSIMAMGHSIFQIHKLADTDETHIAKLLERYDFPIGATVLDLGCGIGVVARTMKRQRPDLDFVLVNISQSQLDLCPDFRKVCADFQDVPLDEQFDAVMINYALGHGELDRVLLEAHRLTKSGGKVVIYDITGPVHESMGYTAHAIDDVKTAAINAGLVIDRAEMLRHTSTQNFMNITTQDQFDSLFAAVYPVLYVCSKP